MVQYLHFTVMKFQLKNEAKTCKQFGSSKSPSQPLSDMWHDLSQQNGSEAGCTAAGGPLPQSLQGVHHPKSFGDELPTALCRCQKNLVRECG